MLSGVARIGIVKFTDLKKEASNAMVVQKEACSHFAIHMFSETVSIFVKSQL